MVSINWKQLQKIKLADFIQIFEQYGVYYFILSALNMHFISFSFVYHFPMECFYFLSEQLFLFGMP